MSNTYERRLARQRQLEQMEAAASGMGTPDMVLNLQDGEVEITFGTSGLSAPSTSVVSSSLTVGGGGGSTSLRSSTLFERGDAYSSRPAVNLMDHTTGVYTSTYSKQGGWYVSQLLEGVFRSSDTTKKPSSTFWDATSNVPGDSDTDGGDDEYSTFKRHQRPYRRRMNPLVAHCVVLWRTRACKIGLVLAGAAMIAITSVMLTRTPDSVKQATAAQYRLETVADALASRAGIVVPNLDNNTLTAEHQALRWIAWTDGAQLDADDPMLPQRYGLALFFYSSFFRYEQTAGEQHGIDRNNLWKTIPNPGWIRRDYWLSAKSHCLWYGVDCSAEDQAGDRFQPTGHYEDLGDIVGISLRDNHVAGTLPPDLFRALSKLEIMDLSQNRLSGNLPFSVGSNTALEQLNLENNRIEGILPPSIGGMESLQYLRLGANQIRGKIPTEIGRLVNLRHLSAEANKLTGPLPDLQYLVHLHAVWLNGNQIGGTVPASWGENLAAIKELDLSKNQLSGSFPAEFATRRYLKSISVESNRLNGTLPANLFDLMDGLEVLNLQHNQFSGSLPTSLASAYNLQTLLLNGNRFEGELPPDSALAGLGKLKVVHLHDNRLSGQLADLGLFPDLEEFWAYKNKFRGNLPETISECTRLETLYLEHNSLTGPIPSELGSLTSLQELRVFGNNLTGTVPKHVCDLKSTGSLMELSIDCSKVECKEGCCRCKK
jgi:Leucine-rich repeat (LRR) protein